MKTYTSYYNPSYPSLTWGTSSLGGDPLMIQWDVVGLFRCFACSRKVSVLSVLAIEYSREKSFWWPLPLWWPAHQAIVMTCILCDDPLAFVMTCSLCDDYVPTGSCMIFWNRYSVTMGPEWAPIGRDSPCFQGVAHAVCLRVCVCVCVCASEFVPLLRTNVSLVCFDRVLWRILPWLYNALLGHRFTGMSL